MYLVTLVYPVFVSCDLDLDLMTLMYKPDLDILQTYLRTRNKVSWLSLSKLEPWLGIGLGLRPENVGLGHGLESCGLGLGLEALALRP